MTPLTIHGLQVVALLALPLAIRATWALLRPRGHNRLSPQRRARLARYAASPARADDTFTRPAPRTQQRMLRHLQAQRRIVLYLTLILLATAAILTVALAAVGTPRGLWSAPYLVLIFVLAAARAFMRWMSVQDVYMRALSEYSARPYIDGF